MDCLFYRKFQTRKGPLKILLKTPGALARRCEYHAQFSLKRMCKATTLRTSKTNLHTQRTLIRSIASRAHCPTLCIQPFRSQQT